MRPKDAQHPRVWTIDQRMDWWEQHRDFIPEPFSPHERALIRALAAAQYFLETLQEMPGRLVEDPAHQTVNALVCTDMAVVRLQEFHRGRRTDASPTEGRRA
jgi:hypothetical protein